MLDNEAPDTGEAVMAADIIDTPDPPAVTVHEPVDGDADTTWLRLKDHVGVSADGNLEPLVDIGVTVAVPTMVKDPETGKDEIGETVQTLSIGHAETLDIFRPARFIKGGRIVETRDQRVVSALMQTGNFEQIDRPTKKDIAAHVKGLTDATEEAANRSDEER